MAVLCKMIGPVDFAKDPADALRHGEASVDGYVFVDMLSSPPPEFVWDEKESLFDCIIDFCDEHGTVVTVIEMFIMCAMFFFMVFVIL